MFGHNACRAAALVLGLAATTASTRATGPTENAMNGTFALPNATEKVDGRITVRETGPLSRELGLVLTDKATGRTVTRYDEDLTEKLHLLIVDDAFTTFVHEHAQNLDAAGLFRIAVRFPKAGRYHVYTDVHPTGLGQQVVRFDVDVADVGQKKPGDGSEPRKAAAVTEGVDGPYSVRLDANALRAGVESALPFTILKDGKPATDLAPYLGVAAHAVFIGKADLSYVHAHAMPAAQHGGGHGGHGGHDAHGKKPSTVPAELMLHATPPKAGTYGLWIQFIADGEVRTVPFVLEVPEA